MQESAQGDTSYYVKSENGLDSIQLTIPKATPEGIRRMTEERTRNLLNKKLLQEEN